MPSRRVRSPGEVEAPDLAADGSTADVVLRGSEWQDVGADVRFDHGFFETVSFVGGKLTDLEANDCRFIDCDFSGARLDGLSGSRLEFVRCRMRGVVLLESQLENVQFADCMLDDVSLRMATGRWLRFERCSMRAADFLAARLSDTRMEECDLDGATFDRCEVRDVVFERGSMREIEGALHLRGATISHDLAIPVALSVLADAEIAIVPEG